MNKKLIPVAILGTAIVAVAANKQKDPVLMSVDGKDVKLSEFEYLYNKNNTQQIEPLTLEQYVEMFVNYKLKVADAIDEGLDTTKSFKQEFAKHRDELAAPYLRDSATEERLIQEAYSHMANDILVSHIMLKPNQSANEHNDIKLDSIRNLILSGAISFEDAAKKYSIDNTSAMKGGRMGWITGNSRLPWDFEEAAYTTAVGQLSPVIFSGYGYHIVRPDSTRQQRGEVKVQHILVLTQGLDAEKAAAKKERIDSIYNVLVTTDANFAEMASRLSEDPGSARNGGDVGWFGGGRMVPEFEEVAFTLNDGEMSKPFATSYGYHIILKNAHRGDTLASLDQLRGSIKQSIERDSRGQLPVKAWIENEAKKTNSSFNTNLKAQLQQFFASNNIEKVDSANLQLIKGASIPAYTVAGKTFNIGDALTSHPVRLGSDASAAIQQIESAVKYGFDAEIMEYGRDELAKNNKDYSNLINEYRDGILLFDVSNMKVWDKASKDKEGLEEYFKANRDNYAWDSPRYKAYVIFATSDSILNEAQQYANTLSASDLTQEKLTNELKNKFGKDVKIEKVIAAKGENQITDYLGFGQAKPENLNQKWAGYFAFDGKLLDKPEEAADLKGTIISDYQTYLEQEWLKDLHKKHKVKINKKVLKQAK